MTGKWPPFVTITDFNFNLEILFFMFYSFVVYVSGYIFFIFIFHVTKSVKHGGARREKYFPRNSYGKIIFYFSLIL